MLNSRPYTILNKDPSTKHLIEVKRNVKNSVFLKDQTKCMVIPSVANCAIFCARPKIHKPTLDFRPIVSNVGTASYKLACFLSQYLVHLTCNSLYTVKISYNFVYKLKCISSLKYTMFLYDVKSPFTKVLI